MAAPSSGATVSASATAASRDDADFGLRSEPHRHPQSPRALRLLPHHRHPTPHPIHRPDSNRRRHERVVARQPQRAQRHERPEQRRRANAPCAASVTAYTQPWPSSAMLVPRAPGAGTARRSGSACARRSRTRTAASSRAARASRRAAPCQARLIIRRLRRNSPSSVGTILSSASAPAAYTARQPARHPEGKREVGRCRGRRGMWCIAPQRVDRAVARGDAAEARLERAHRHLVAPVGALLVGARRRRREAHLAADVAHRASANGATSRRSASGAQRLLASENATISPRARSTAASCARALPARGRSSTRSAPAPRASSDGAVPRSRRRPRSARTARAGSRGRARSRTFAR